MIVGGNNRYKSNELKKILKQSIRHKRKTLNIDVVRLYNFLFPPKNININKGVKKEMINDEEIIENIKKFVGYNIDELVEFFNVDLNTNKGGLIQNCLNKMIGIDEPLNKKGLDYETFDLKVVPLNYRVRTNDFSFIGQQRVSSIHPEIDYSEKGSFKLSNFSQKTNMVVVLHNQNIIVDVQILNKNKHELYIKEAEKAFYHGKKVYEKKETCNQIKYNGETAWDCKTCWLSNPNISFCVGLLNEFFISCVHNGLKVKELTDIYVEISEEGKWEKYELKYKEIKEIINLEGLSEKAIDIIKRVIELDKSLN